MFVTLIAFITPISYAFTNILDAYINNRVFKRISTVIFYGVITNIIVLPFLFLFGRPSWPTLQILPYLLTAAFLEVGYMVPYFKAIRRIDTSINTALLSLGQIIIPVLAYFMVDEKLSLSQNIGFLIIIFFNVLLSLEKGVKIKLNSAFWLMFFVSLILSVQAVLFKKIVINIGWISTVFWIAILTSIFSCVFLLDKTSRRDICRASKIFTRRWKLFIGNEIFNQMAVIAEKFALSALPVVTYCAIYSTQALFVLVFSVIYQKLTGKHLKEKTGKRAIFKKTICFVMIIIGVILTAG